jgi:hypothetical protein
VCLIKHQDTWGSGGIALLILKHGTTRRWVSCRHQVLAALLPASENINNHNSSNNSNFQWLYNNSNSTISESVCYSQVGTSNGALCRCLLTKFSWIYDYNSWFTSYSVFRPCTGIFEHFISVNYEQAEHTSCVSHMVLYKCKEHYTVYTLFVISPLCISFVSSGMMTVM